MLFNIHTHFFTGRTIEIVSRTNWQKDGEYFSVGIHPWDSDNLDFELEMIQNEIKNPFCLAIGEIGLDKLKGPNIEIQENVFRKQIALSEEFQLPVIIHCVKAWNELQQLKRELKPSQTWVFHGFSKAAILENVLQEGLMISIGTAILTNKKLQDVLNNIPNDRLFLETDDAEIPIYSVYEKVSELKKLSLSELEQIIENNFKKVFTKWTIGSNEQNL